MERLVFNTPSRWDGMTESQGAVFFVLFFLGFLLVFALAFILWWLYFAPVVWKMQLRDVSSSGNAVIYGAEVEENPELFIAGGMAK